jgi:drug/metabolite transporter (DMT)-like permease
MLTLIFAWLVLHETPTIWQILGFLPIAAGIYFLTKKPSKLVKLEVETK